MEAKINSANVEKISWSADRTLRIYFKTGQIVAYKDVPEGIAVGIAQSRGPASFITRYVSREYSYVVEKQSEITERNKKLEHHKDTTVGLYATDRPDLIPTELKSLFFCISYNEREQAQKGEEADDA